MRNKKKCTICGQRFEAVRSDKIYCSNACKQKAHNSRTNKPMESAKQLFDLNEYTYLCECWGVGGEDFPFIFFCFLRTKLPEKISKQALEIYFNSVWTRESYSDLISTNAYRSFQEEFLASEKGIVSITV